MTFHNEVPAKHDTSTPYHLLVPQKESGVSVAGGQAKRDIMEGVKRETALLLTSSVVVAGLIGLGVLLSQ